MACPVPALCLYSLTEESQDANLKIGVQFTVEAPKPLEDAMDPTATPIRRCHRCGKSVAQPVKGKCAQCNQTLEDQKEAARRLAVARANLRKEWKRIGAGDFPKYTVWDGPSGAEWKLEWRGKVWDSGSTSRFRYSESVASRAKERLINDVLAGRVKIPPEEAK